MNASNSVTNDGQNEVMENLIEEKLFEHKPDAVAYSLKDHR